jgi:antitoxin MazE
MAQATIQMWGNTRAVRIPKGLAEELSLEPGTRVELSRVGTQLLLRPVNPRKQYRLSDLLAQCKGKNPHGELIRGRVGRELL